ncbi:2-oxoisovalerate dehydrogenase subunit alpha 1, mitochondrial [Andrographis paniculata]|uniref:2-oxoisovalerate dehydrogenase subunit alpha 1, mitochondrial n=1 Tax=Andrographis paniculata TaxID=175694 RepID=UPI0021E851AE|nr:2-oxoisovalerate dehydrogenase subunit alpha 1, mitochondrial [Andrographis paniculata]
MAAALLRRSRAITNLVRTTATVSLSDQFTALQFHRYRRYRRSPAATGDFAGKPYGLCNEPPFASRRFESAAAGQPIVAETDEDDDGSDRQGVEFPGGRVPFTPQMRFIPESSNDRVPCYRVLDDDGYPIEGGLYEEVDKEIAVRMYRSMVTLQTMDTILYEAQRQGRISFYMTAGGEEAVNIGTAAALSSDDIVLPQYREAGILLWRGYTLQEFANQCFGTKNDPGKGRQMPIHYGSKDHNYITVSSPLTTQLPQAVGVAYSLKMDGKNACAVAFVGDGATSEGDFHAALNFAAVMDAPVLFVCRNNGWAISTPLSEQFRSDGVVVKGQAYGIPSIRVDGNDALAVHATVHAAREMVVREQKPILIEAMTYRVGHHSTSDDSTKYRSPDEIEQWRTSRSPVTRFRKFVERNGWWSHDEETELRASTRKQVLKAIQTADKMEKPSLEDLFTDVYDQVPENLQEQEKAVRDAVRRHPQEFPTDVPL